jgi:hypothetical protein
VFTIGSATTHQIDLKGIEGEIPTRNFVVKPQSVVQVKQGENLVTFSQSINQVVESLKVQDASGVIKSLVPSGNNAYSLAGFPTGAYILDVIVDLGSNKKGAYETILVILAQGQQPVPPQQIIQKVQISDDIRIIFPPDDNQTNATTTEEIIPDPPVEGEQVPKSDWIPIVVDWWDDEGLHGKTIYYNSVAGETREPLPYSASGLPLCHDPIYGSGALGNKCHDELDHDTCEDGFVDKGKGCEPVDNDPVICQQYIGNPCIEDGITPPPSPDPQVFPDDTVEYPVDDGEEDTDR